MLHQLLLALLTVMSAHGFVAYYNADSQPLRWNLQSLDESVPTNCVNRATRAIRYFLARDAYSATNTTAELNAVRAAFGQWQSVSNTVLKFEAGGLVEPGIDVNTEDETNVVFWAKHGTIVNGGLADISGLLGVTYSRFYDDNTLAEADIVLNGVDVAWFTDMHATNQPAYLVESTALHEIGHFLGLDHSPVGAATMMWRGAPGLGLHNGLSADEFAALRFLYPQAQVASGYVKLQGKVTKGGLPVRGAALFLLDESGSVVAGTVSREAGAYSFEGLIPGSYVLRAAPLDPISASDQRCLVRGGDIAAEYFDADTDFVASPLLPVQVLSSTVQFDVVVAAGKSPFRVVALRRPSGSASIYNYSAAPVQLLPGATDVYLGLLSPDMPSTGVTLHVSGGGVSLESPFTDRTGLGFVGIHAKAKVAADAPPGLRDLWVEQGPSRVYANGFLEIGAVVQDYNFDGLNDEFQRRYFPVFTDPQAAPDADPDSDGFTNRREFLAGSDPTDARSVRFRIQKVTVSAKGTELLFETGKGKRYQVYRRANLESAAWVKVGQPALATADTTVFLDSASTQDLCFYEVEALP